MPTTTIEEIQQKPRLLPPYAVVIENDDEHTFDYVIMTLKKVFGYPVPKGFSYAKEIHDRGEAAVWKGPLEVAEFKRDQIKSVGPDIYGGVKVGFPLSVRLEPLE